MNELQAKYELPRVSNVLRTPERRFTDIPGFPYQPRWTEIGGLFNAGCATTLSAAEIAAYDAPFPDSRHKTAARLFPGFVPATPSDPERANNERAWEVFERWQKPFLTLFSSGDPITRGGEKVWQKRVPGARGQPHAIIRGAGHFLQEDKGPELAQAISSFIRATPRDVHDRRPG